ncbi:MAG: hypothetical protein JOZ90_03320 [Alphaproteobacteria bacterium]|nr:hypothetical protein [Alphaproteobacteria bacterium]MBV9370810.1 hypothetical protein [Alphaproteobacteria bacterium]MBV9900110.1 hypothetical protein [Alphaproteobacteria bacterium]
MTNSPAKPSTPGTAAQPAWRPPVTVAQAGARQVDWTRTFHVNDAQAFVSGLFALYQDAFEPFLKDAGHASAIGETTLYQVAQGPQLRFEIKRLGPNEFEVRGAHFATPSGTNICIGLNPHQ